MRIASTAQAHIIVAVDLATKATELLAFLTGPAMESCVTQTAFAYQELQEVVKENAFAWMVGREMDEIVLILTSVRRPMSSVTSMRIASTAQARSNVDVDLATKATEAIVFPTVLAMESCVMKTVFAYHELPEVANSNVYVIMAGQEMDGVVLILTNVIM